MFTEACTSRGFFVVLFCFPSLNSLDSGVMKTGLNLCHSATRVTVSAHRPRTAAVFEIVALGHGVVSVTGRDGHGDVGVFDQRDSWRKITRALQ